MPSLGGWELVILVGILVLLFGAKRLPDMARSIGQSARVFKGEMKGMKDDGKGADKGTPADDEAPAAQAEPAPLPPAGTVPPAGAVPPAATVPVEQPVPVQEPSRAAGPGSGRAGQ